MNATLAAEVEGGGGCKGRGRQGMCDCDFPLVDEEFLILDHLVRKLISRKTRLE